MTSRAEEEYFFRQEVEKLKKLAEQRRKELEAAERERQKQLHFMHCPKCGESLHTVHYGAIEIDRCFGCGGLWLDDGELEKVLEQEKAQNRSIFRAILGGLRGDSAG